MSEPTRPSSETKRTKTKRKRVTKVYVCHKGEKLGPFSRLEVGRGLANGDYKLSDLAWYNRLTMWIPLEQLPPHTDAGPLYPMPALPPGVAKSPETDEASDSGKRRRRTSSSKTAESKSGGLKSRILRFFGSDDLA